MDAAVLMAFCAEEFQTFFSHLAEAMKHYRATGQLETVFKASAVAQAATHGDKKAKAKRKPTAFNMFVKDKMEHFKAAGVKLEDDKNGNMLFSLAVAEWGKLDDDQKQEYTRNFKVRACTASSSTGRQTTRAPLFAAGHTPFPWHCATCSHT